MDQSQYLLSYRDTAVGDLRGFEIDLAHEIARDIFGDPDRVDFRFVESGRRVAALEEGDVDIIVRTMSITPERAKNSDFSVPYLASAVRLLTPSTARSPPSPTPPRTPSASSTARTSSSSPAQSPPNLGSCAHAPGRTASWPPSSTRLTPCCRTTPSSPA
ncbi:transporter substrate-binding domain-containing protein [Corynebacterium timonense]|uniref:transporter substrate-binding domain-containing protein n=1 Tax=Corynebacterium timonense TaxID=441500 RepID=UPI0039DFEE97